MEEHPFLLTIKPQNDSSSVPLTLAAESIKRQITKNTPRHVRKNSSAPYSQVFENYVFQSKQSSAEKSMVIYEKLSFFIERFPQHFEDSLLTDFMRLLVLTNQDFLEERSVRHITCLVCSHSLIYKQLARSFRFLPEERHLFLRFMHTRLKFTFGTKAVLGIVMGICPLNAYELFDEKHILMAVQQFMPSVTAVEGSFYASQNRHDHICLLYIEIEKDDGNKFSLEEVRLLKNGLANALKVRVEKLLPSLFMTRNEEEVMKTILILSQELRYRDSLPQVMISFESQSPTELFFTVIVVHLVGSQKPFFEKAMLITNDCTWTPNRIQIVDYLSDRTPKQAVVFHVKMEKSTSLLRADFSINFYLARQKLIKKLQESLGVIRDYNGGLIFQQGERLAEFRQEFAQEAALRPDLVENFFYSLTPIEVQATLSLELLKKLFKLCLEAISKPLPKRESYFFKIEVDDVYSFVVVCVRDSIVKECFLNTMAFLGVGDPFVSASVTFQGYYILGYIHKSTRDCSGEQFVFAIEQAIAEGISEIESSQSLRFVFPSLPTSLDPRIGGDIYSAIILNMLFEGLMRYGEDGELTYGVCESITISVDGKKYTFHLRKSFWSDEAPVTAHDFAYAWKKILSPDFYTPYTYLFYPIKWAKDAKEGKISVDQVGIQVIDDHTLFVELEHPTPYFLELTALSLYSPVPHLLAAIQSNWAQQSGKSYVCNGPFRLEKRSQTQGVLELIKNPSYWDSQYRQPHQVLVIQGNAQEALEMFKNDEIDWLGSPLQDWNPYLFLQCQEQVESSVSSGVFWSVFNTGCFPFDNVKLRRAFSLAINRKELAEAFVLDDLPAYSPLPFMHSQRGDAAAVDGDEVKALELFDEALKELGITKKEFPSLHVIHGVQDLLLNTIIRFVVERWQQLFGINCKTKGLKWGTAFDKLVRGDFQLGFIRWEAWVDDPIYTLNAFRHAGERMNPSKWENTKYQELLDAADETIDMKKRSEYLAEAESMLIDQLPVTPLLYEMRQFVKKSYLRVPVRKNVGVFDFRFTFKEFYKRSL